MAKELNDAGFKDFGYDPNAGQCRRNAVPYKVYSIHTFFEAMRDFEAIDYLKSIGLLNDKRCPLCGGPIKGTPSRYTHGLEPRLTYYICSSCRREGQRYSINPASHTSCILALALMPWYIVKHIATSIFNSL